MEQRKAAVVSQHVSKAGAYALDSVVGGRPRAAMLSAHFDKGEQRAVSDELVEDAPGLAQALVRIDLLAVLECELSRNDSHLVHHALYSKSHAVAASASFASESLLAMPKSSIPASSLGLSVVQRFTWLATWNVRRWMRAVGQTAFAALEKPGDPSVTTISGGGILSMSAAHAEADSVRARCHPITYPSAIAMSTTAFLRSQMPSKNTTLWTSPVKGAIGQSLHAQEVFLQNVALLVARSATASLENSHRRNALSVLALLSILRTLEAPHFGQRQRLVPAFVVPLPFILESQTGHFGLFTPASCPSATFCGRKLA